MQQYSVATPPSTPGSVLPGSAAYFDPHNHANNHVNHHTAQYNLATASSMGQEAGANTAQGLGLSRKQRKLVRHMEHKKKAEAKKLKTGHVAANSQQNAMQGGIAQYQAPRFHIPGGPTPRPGTQGGAGYRPRAPTLPNWGSGLLQSNPNPVWNQQFRQSKPY